MKMFLRRKIYLKNYMVNITKEDALRIYQEISKIFPDAHCELNYRNPFELLVATLLSAQTTDVSVNKVTPALFEKYSSPYLLKEADINEVMNIIKSIGLYKNKAKNIISLANELVEKYNGEVLADYDILITLPGVGRKTANVVLAEIFDEPRIAVDTHVLRVSNVLKLSKSNNPLQVEKDLMKLYDKALWKDLHLKLLFFGRYMCKAQKPDCELCPFKKICEKYKNMTK